MCVHTVPIYLAEKAQRSAIERIAVASRARPVRLSVRRVQFVWNRARLQCSAVRHGSHARISGVGDNETGNTQKERKKERRNCDCSWRCVREQYNRTHSAGQKVC